MTFKQFRSSFYVRRVHPHTPRLLAYNQVGLQEWLHGEAPVRPESQAVSILVGGGAPSSSMQSSQVASCAQCANAADRAADNRPGRVSRAHAVFASALHDSADLGQRTRGLVVPDSDSSGRARSIFSPRLQVDADAEVTQEKGDRRPSPLGGTVGSDVPAAVDTDSRRVPYSPALL
jgi:hypothetical protein